MANLFVGARVGSQSKSPYRANSSEALFCGYPVRLILYEDLNMKPRIHISIAFGDVILPVIQLDDGQQRVPLKPICDHIGLDWKTQKRKLLNDDYFIERFGLILGETNLPQLAELGLKRDLYLIRLDRVTAFLNTLNPRTVGSKGNTEAADWLKAKHIEWDNALHAYETNGFAAKPSGSHLRYALYKLDRIKNPAIKIKMAESINDEFGLDLPITKQEQMTL